MFDKSHRFHGLNSLSFAYKRGQIVRGGQLTLRYTTNPRRQTFRVAVVVSKKVDKSAVVRNRIRRRVYEAARLETRNLQAPYDLIFSVFDAQLATNDATELRKQVAVLLRRAGLTTPKRAIVDHKKTEEQ
jgi:ribonuclease P protein component